VSASDAGDAAAAAARAQRVRARLEAAYEDPERQVFLPTLDLSESGVFLLSTQAPAVGSHAQVVLELPGHEAFLRLRGAVTRVQLEPVAGFALRFENDAPNAEALDALREFVRREGRSG
jgi:hypothetical protein